MHHFILALRLSIIANHTMSYRKFGEFGGKHVQKIVLLARVQSKGLQALYTRYPITIVARELGLAVCARKQMYLAYNFRPSVRDNRMYCI